MFAKLASIAGVGSSLPFTADADAAYETSWGGWSHMPGTLREDGSAVSIFKKSAPKGDKKLDTARNGVKRLRMMRHPNVLSFKTSIEVEERSEIVVYIVTEPVKPLLQVMTDLNLEGMQRDQYLTMGLYHVASAVSFLSNDVDLVHGNICLAAIVVTPTLDWKLHGLDLMTEHAMPERPPPLAAASFLVGAQYLPGEVGKSDWDAISQGPPWAVDAWGMGCLMQEVYSCKVLAQIEQLRNTECIPEGLRQDYQRLLSSQPTRRLNPAKLVSESGFLKNTLVKTVVFLENLSVKDSAEKDQFFRKLPNLLPSFPQSLCVQKFLPLLQNALEYGGAPPIALSAVLKIGNTLEPEEFQGRVIPIVTKLFTSQERAIRKSLLENISLFGPHLTEKVCEDQIFPEVVKGFTDTNDYLRELTLRSMLTLAPKLTQRTLNNSLLKYLAKLQVDETPGIRANTTVLLGNIAPYLGEAACKRVLLNAFTRALKDQFPPARIAALKALMATSDRHSAEEAAQRIMPSVMPFFVDPIKDVRKAAVQCSDAYIKILKKNAGAMDKRDDEAAEKAAADAAAGGPASAPVPAAQGPQAIKRQDSGKSGYLSWAVSLMSTTGSSAKAAPPPPETERDTGQASASEGAAAQSKTAVDPEPSQAADTRKEVLDTALGAAPGDGWGDDDELLGLEEQEDEAEVQARLRMERLKQKLAAKAKPPVQRKPEASRGTDGATAGLEKEASARTQEEDDPFEDMGMGAPEPTKARLKPAPAARPRPPSAKPKASKPMKLGAQKLSSSDKGSRED